MAELVTDYLEGAVAWPVWLGARLHLLQCDACRHYFDQMRKTVRLLADRPVGAPPALLVDRLVAEGVRGADDGPRIAPGGPDEAQPPP